MGTADAGAAMLSGVAHDLSNLLTAVFGYLELARGELSPDHPASRYLREMERVAQWAAGIGNALQAFSHARSAQPTLLDVALLVESAGRLIRPLLGATTNLRIDRWDGPLPAVLGDRAQLLQVLVNLAIRVRETASDGGQLHIGAIPSADAPRADGVESEARSWVTLVVGAGRAAVGPEEILARPAADEGPRLSRPGLGLALVLEIIHSHGGVLSVQRSASDGEQYTVRLPAAVPGARDAAPAPEGPALRASGELVLVGEGYAQVRGLIVGALRERGFEVLAVGDGDEFLANFEAHADRARVLILDVALPRRTGIACLEAIRRRGPQPPTILVTGDPAHDCDSWCDGNTVLLRKPFAISELVQRALKLLHSTTRAAEVAP